MVKVRYIGIESVASKRDEWGDNFVRSLLEHHKLHQLHTSCECFLCILPCNETPSLFHFI